MAVIKDTNKRGRIGPSMRGQFYSYEKNGGLVLAKWPEKRGKPRSEAQADAQRLFIEACAAMKRMDSAFIEYARLNSKGTPMLPRDALMAALYGRGPVIILPNGEKRYPMASRIDMSMLLDNLADKDGMILFRGNDDLWIGLPIGDAGQVLTVDADGLPSWQPQTGGGGGGSSWLIPNPGAFYTPTYPTHGCQFWPLCDLNVSKMLLNHKEPAGTATYAMGCYVVDNSNIVTRVAAKKAVALTCDGTARTECFNFDTPGRVYANEKCIFAFSKTSWVTGQTFLISSSASRSIFFPNKFSTVYVEANSPSPEVGDEFILTTGNPYCVGGAG